MKINQVMPDVVAIGTQETNGDRTEWEVSIQETLGAGHVLFHSVELGTLHLAVFLRRDLIWVASIPESETHSVRAGSAFRTKGGVAIGFSLFGTTILFLNCHLTAHAEKVWSSYLRHELNCSPRTVQFIFTKRQPRGSGI